MGFGSPRRGTQGVRDIRIRIQLQRALHSAQIPSTGQGEDGLTCRGRLTMGIAYKLPLWLVNVHMIKYPYIYNYIYTTTKRYYAINYHYGW